MADSHFASDYYREKVYSHIDNINLLYVALTRAAESLHIFIPTPSVKGRQNDTVGKLLLSSLSVTDRKMDTEGCEYYEFGEFTGPCTGKANIDSVKSFTIENYNTVEADMRLRLPSQRYFEDDERAELSPRNFGILMHRAFADAANINDIYSSIEQMIRDAVISSKEGEQLHREVTKALENPTIAEWFNEEWSEIRNENDIIVPRGESARRPDRVMTKGRRAIVVDYKFGNREQSAYTEQLRDYMSLLTRIGYTPVEGYVWYVRLGKIVEVTQ
jgi:ATP-dependent exoDNAse (exonuclease V) beta subunit